MTEKTYRHEYKYLVREGQIQMLKARINGIMDQDRNVNSDGTYVIRSAYFDDMGDRCFFDNDNSNDDRAKYRIRIYNASDASIKLELKESLFGKKHKTADRLSREYAEKLLAGEYIRSLNQGADEGNHYKVLPGLCADMMVNRMRPVIIVEYDRTPYVYREGNVRVTFDMNISSSPDIGAFFDQRIRKRLIMPAGLHLMEVKFDDFLPDVIYRALQLDYLKRTTFSKYYLSRIYSL